MAMERNAPVADENLNTLYVDRSKGPRNVNFIPIRSSWYFDPNDPLAITVKFHDSMNGEVEWTFSRDLLRIGLIGDTKLSHPFSDVRFYKNDTSIYMEVNSPTGHAEFKLLHSAMNTFYTNTVFSVPPAFEEETVIEELNRELYSILNSE